MRAQVGLGQRNRLLKQTGTWRIKGQNYNNAGAVCFKLPHPSESLAKILLENDLTLLLDWTTTLWWQPSTYLSTVCELKVVFTWLEKEYFMTWEVYEIHTSVSIKFYWNTAPLTHLHIINAMAAFAPQQHNWEVASEIIQPQNLTYLLSDSLWKKFASPSFYSIRPLWRRHTMTLLNHRKCTSL